MSAIPRAERLIVALDVPDARQARALAEKLGDAVRFYAQRDTAPQRWYGRDAKGRTQPFDDLPEAYHENINTDPPFGQQRGGKPALTESEIRDVVAFLKGLDGTHGGDQAADEAFGASNRAMSPVTAPSKGGGHH